MGKSSKATPGTDSRGRKSPFCTIKGADEWIAHLFPAYDKVPAGGDDRIVWVKARRKEFTEKFKVELEGLGFSKDELTKKFNAKFNTHKSFVNRQNAKEKGEASIPLLQTVLKLTSEKPPIGYTLFCNEMEKLRRSESVILTGDTQTEDSTSTDHPGTAATKQKIVIGDWQKEMSKRWKGLSNEAREKYNSEAAATSEENIDDVYRNQKNIITLIEELFKSLTGYGAGKCGDISFLLLVSFINAKGIIENDVLNVEADQDSAFIHVKKAFTEEVINEWVEHNKNNLKNTCPEDEDAIDVSLPVLADHTSVLPEDVRRMIGEFILNLWVYAQRGQDIIDQSMPWAQILETPQKFISISSWPPSIPLKTTTAMTLPELYVIAESIRAHQKEKPTIPYITFKSNNSSNGDAATTNPANTSGSKSTRKTTVILDSDDEAPPKKGSRSTIPHDDDDDDDAWSEVDKADRDPRIEDPEKGVSVIEEMMLDTPIIDDTPNVPQAPERATDGKVLPEKPTLEEQASHDLSTSTSLAILPTASKVPDDSQSNADVDALPLAAPSHNNISTETPEDGQPNGEPPALTTNASANLHSNQETPISADVSLPMKRKRGRPAKNTTPTETISVEGEGPSKKSRTERVTRKTAKEMNAVIADNKTIVARSMRGGTSRNDKKA
ncbi:hypothetical protein SCHPADRAFT_896686 [Schizopora paradoxa]|uniref:Uncharacterized protein n=1 Tax=Schizopora paradoxa TaxID=27342 RepID=A0A0H2QZG8_9AGAM|nr:hypothetical protein SCHPADRAFT_896686 [Schizopora paradoxa]